MRLRGKSYLINHSKTRKILFGLENKKSHIAKPKYENVDFYVSSHNYPPVKGEYRNLEFRPSPNNIVI